MKGNLYRFRRAIPEALQRHFNGRQFYVVSLGTGDVVEAKRRRDSLERETDKLFADLRRNGITEPARDSIRELAETWARELAESRKDPVGWTEKITGHSYDDEGASDAHEYVMAAGEEIGREHGEAVKRTFLDEVFGRVEAGRYRDDYLREVKLAPKTMRDRTGHLNRFARWAEAEGLRLADIDRRKAGKYFSGTLAKGDRATAVKHLSSLRGYWDWLTVRGHVPGRIVRGRAENNPWEGQQLPDRSRRVERGDRTNTERPFTTKEMQTLLYPPEAEKRRALGRTNAEQIDDAIRISALSGMRLAEVITLWRSEVDEQEGFFSVGQGKSGAAIRRVPIHPDLKAIVKRRVKGKQPKDWLFHELQTERDPGDTFSKRFGRYRERLGVDDDKEGKRRSLVNFHSFRRWFVTEAERGDIPVSTIASVVGHSEGREGVTLGVYSRGPSDAQLKACVEAVRLPTKTV